MNPQQTDGAGDEFHSGDWPLTNDGFLVPTPLMVDPSNRVQVCAQELAAHLYLELPGIYAIYLRGSAIESTRPGLVRDVDVVVVAGASELNQQQLDMVAARLWPAVKEWPPCDLALVRLDRLKRQPFTTIIQLILAFRAALLAGVPVWDESPKVKADRELAQHCQDTHRRLVTRFTAKASAAPHKYDAARLVSWMQKRALRLGGILSMGVSGTLSRHPMRCSTLISRTYPDLSVLATRVATDYIAQRADESAWIASRALFDALAVRGDELTAASR